MATLTLTITDHVHEGNKGVCFNVDINPKPAPKDFTMAMMIMAYIVNDLGEKVGAPINSDVFPKIPHHEVIKEGQ